MKAFRELSQDELQTQLAEQRAQHGAFAAQGLKLNMARGKPAPEQLDLSMPLLDIVPSEGSHEELHAGAADDLRNYGGPIGLPAIRELMGSILGVPAANVIAMGNSSLTLMYNQVSMAMSHGILGATPWNALDGQPAFLCPAPGYDRHFAITQHFGIRMITVPLLETGPNMAVVEELVASDRLIKGIWCVPRFSNPTGCVYSDETVERLGALRPAAEDFRIYWDNAYAVHALADKAPALRSLKDACDRAHNSNIWFQFASSSKITFAGGGVAALASSEENLAEIILNLGFMTIGPDKINQKRHALFLPNLEAVEAHMRKHAAIVGPKFDLVQQVFARELEGLGIGTWSTPKGGYFISFEGLPQTARRTVELAAEAGVVLTPAGATYPYGEDPLDSNIRIAPTYPGLEELEMAAEVFVVCVRIAALEQLLEG